jgi:hypothetical protein
VGASIHFPAAAVVEACAAVDLGYVIIDMEHSEMSHESAAPMLIGA